MDELIQSLWTEKEFAAANAFLDVCSDFSRFVAGPGASLFMQYIRAALEAANKENSDETG